MGLGRANIMRVALRRGPCVRKEKRPEGFKLKIKPGDLGLDEVCDLDWWKNGETFGLSLSSVITRNSQCDQCACQKGAELPSLPWVCIGSRTHICPKEPWKGGTALLRQNMPSGNLSAVPRWPCGENVGRENGNLQGSIPGALMISLPPSDQGRLREVPSKLNQLKNSEQE